MAVLDLSKFDDVMIEGTQEVKKKGIVDIVFLIDVSGSMGPAIAGLAKNIGNFVDKLEENNVPDWRARVLSFSDLDYDAPDLAMNLERPYVKKAQDLVNQLAESVELVKRSGGQDEPESSMDALYKISSETNNSFPEEYTERTRIVILLTDASPKKVKEETMGADLDGIDMTAQNIKTNRINVFIYGPKNDDYNELASQAGSRVTYNVINPQDENPVDALKNLDFSNITTTLAKTVSQITLL